MFFVYIVQCADSSFYIGCTNNLEKRIKEHNLAKSAGAKYTKTRRPVVLMYSETYATLAEGRRREAALKRLTRRAKEALFKDKPAEA